MLESARLIAFPACEHSTVFTEDTSRVHAAVNQSQKATDQLQPLTMQPSLEEKMLTALYIRIYQNSTHRPYLDLLAWKIFYGIKVNKISKYYLV